MHSRERALTELGERRFDLLVIGGGIIGAGIASTAAAHGLAVALVDRGDFGGATSSTSSKLIHGGLRYLVMGDVSLVREAHQERRALMQVVAPHLVRRLPFMFPLYRGGPYRPFVVKSGILLYSALARGRLSWSVDAEHSRRLVPDLRTEGLHSCALYHDAWTNDGRLTLENVRAAADAGATVLNYAEVVALRSGEGAEVAA
ncbi:MAG: FAD-dependent oxidoreductase, partial [Gaiellaceae bacterium]